MISANENLIKQILAPSRQIKGSVAFYAGATTTPSYFTYADALQSIEISRVGEEGKFFGFGVCQKATIKLRDKERQININKGDGFSPSFAVADNGTMLYAASTYARLYADEIQRDENTNVLTITAADKLYTDAFKYKYSDLGLAVPYTIWDVAAACADKLGLFLETDVMSGFSRRYETEANFDGTETLREVMNAIAEATQTIYYIQGAVLYFKCLSRDDVIYTVDKAQYFSLDSKTQHTLAAICSATELGDNVIATSSFEGETQYVRNNPFWDTQDDVYLLVNGALAVMSGIQSHQFNCSWRGNFLLEIGDKIEFITKDNSSIYGYFLNDITTYDGGFRQVTSWNYSVNAHESADNPSTIGAALSQTFAKVDKVNKTIELMASDVAENTSRIASLELNTGEIVATITENKEITDGLLEEMNEELVNLINQTQLAMTAEDVKISIKEELANGVTSVTTETGFTFNQDGLTINKSNSEMETTITEDGMTVKKSGETVLTANNEGVTAVDLKAKGYLIIGENSRFEDWGNRTACFWIGEKPSLPMG